MEGGKALMYTCAHVQVGTCICACTFSGLAIIINICTIMSTVCIMHWQPCMTTCICTYTCIHVYIYVPFPGRQFLLCKRPHVDGEGGDGTKWT